MNKLLKIFCFLIVIAFACMMINGQGMTDRIIEEGEETICKLTVYQRSGRICTAFVKYNVADKHYRTRCECPEKGAEKLDKYFYLKYLPEDPNVIRVNFSREVKDKSLITELESKLTFKYWLDH